MQENEISDFFKSDFWGNGNNNRLKIIAYLVLGGVFIGLSIIGFLTILNLFLVPTQFLYLVYFILFILLIGKRNLAFLIEDKVVKLPIKPSTLPIKFVPIITCMIIIFVYLKMK